jgi:TonB family protein
MSFLFDEAGLTTRPRRSSKGLWVSFAVHSVFAGLLVVVPKGAAGKTQPKSIPVFLMPTSEPPKRVVHIETPRVPVVIKPPVHEVVVAKVPEPVVVKPIVPKPIQPPPAALLPAKVPAFERPVVKAPERAPETGTFERANAAKPKALAAAVASGGFDVAAPVARGTGQSAAVTTGGFDVAAPASRGTGQTAAVATGGFGGTAPSPRGTGTPTAAVATGGFAGNTAVPIRGIGQATGTVATGGFGSTTGSPRGVPGGTGTGEVQTSGFERARAVAPAPTPNAAPTRPIDTPVEIIYKPTPEYTDEARSAHIQGTVTLELEFGANGDIRVLRLMRGLGHGLDEAAERAAKRIRFKPAQSDGRAVDSRAKVQITFQLS